MCGALLSCCFFVCMLHFCNWYVLFSKLFSLTVLDLSQISLPPLFYHILTFPSGIFIHITDIHLDPEYKVGGNTLQRCINITSNENSTITAGTFNIHLFFSSHPHPPLIISFIFHERERGPCLLISPAYSSFFSPLFLCFLKGNGDPIHVTLL